MDSTANVNVRVNGTVKSEAEHVLSNIGLNMSTAINIYLIKIANEHRIPFELSMPEDPFYSSSNMRELRQRAENFDACRSNAVELSLDEWDALVRADE